MNWYKSKIDNLNTILRERMNHDKPKNILTHNQDASYKYDRMNEKERIRTKREKNMKRAKESICNNKGNRNG